MKQKIFICLLAIAFSCATTFAQQKKYTISGYITEEGSKETLIGVNIYLPSIESGTASNNYGFYSITLPEGEYSIYFSYVGYTPVKRQIILDKNIELNVALESNIELEEIKISARKEKRLSNISQMSVIDIPVMQVKNIPGLLGEKDVLKTIQLMPGVQSGSEGNSGFYVRGGGPDQNLIILDDAPVYNANHLFGFFSIFNGDALKSISLMKGGFPARYGGRLSSVLEMSMKDGNKQELSGEAGIGLISSRLTLEGPIIKDKSSFVLSGRRTYIDILSKPFMPSDNKTGYYFYDLNAKVNYEFNRNNKIYLSGYFGRDNFNFKSIEEGDPFKGGLYWGNATGTFRWNHLFSERIFSNTSFIFSDYTFSIFSKEYADGNSYELDYSSGIKDIGLKYDLQFLFNPNYFIRTGFSSTYHLFRPNAVVLKDESINQYERSINTIKTIESAIYLENELKISNRMKVNAGLRISHYIHKNKSYFNPETRLSINYSLAPNLSVKASYADMNQYVHLLSSGGISLPLDLWVPTTDKVNPQHSQQVAIGLAKDFPKNNYSISVEGYYKKMNNIIGYAPGSSFLTLQENPEDLDEFNWEEILIRGQGWSYGTELLLQKRVGRLSGWIGYTLSWTQHQFNEDNGGEKFFARYDRRHDISTVAIYKLSKKISLSGTWVYGTGNAVTLPTSEFSADIHNIDDNSSQVTAKNYGRKNDYRMKPYHRLDIGIQFHKKKKNWERTWDISLYNAYSRKNPFFYNIEKKDGKNVLKQISLFPIIPSISYNIKF